MRDVTVCLTYFKSLTLANLSAALYSVRQQDLRRVEEIIIVDNDTSDQTTDIRELIDSFQFPVPTVFHSYDHNNPTRTHSWSTNVAVREVKTPWVLFTRADYILDFSLLDRFRAIIDAESIDWNGFVTANVYHLNPDIDFCETTSWRRNGTQVLRVLSGVENDYTVIDAGVWMTTKAAFNRVGGLDESLTAWGHAQTHFQHKLYRSGVEFRRIPEPLFFHPMHAGERNLSVAHSQLAAQGIDLREMWSRYEGTQPY